MVSVDISIEFYRIMILNHSKYYARMTMDKFALKQQNKRNNVYSDSLDLHIVG